MEKSHVLSPLGPKPPALAMPRAVSRVCGGPFPAVPLPSPQAGLPLSSSHPPDVTRPPLQPAFLSCSAKTDRLPCPCHLVQAPLTRYPGSMEGSCRREKEESGERKGGPRPQCPGQLPRPPGWGISWSLGRAHRNLRRSLSVAALPSHQPPGPPAPTLHPTCLAEDGRLLGTSLGG